MSKLMHELKFMKWSKPTDVAKQSGYIILVTTLLALTLAAFDTGVKYLISFIF